MKSILELMAHEATFQIAIRFNRSRSDSYSKRMRWARIYFAYPDVFQRGAMNHWALVTVRESYSFAETPEL